MVSSAAPSPSGSHFQARVPTIARPLPAAVGGRVFSFRPQILIELVLFQAMPRHYEWSRDQNTPLSTPMELTFTGVGKETLYV